MDRAKISAEVLRRQIFAVEEDLARLKKQLAELEAVDAQSHRIVLESKEATGEDSQEQANKQWPLTSEEYQRYGRQMIVPSVGIQGQLRLKGASVLIIGAGGLGCPAAAYLAGAGVGTLGLIDGDTVETSNLHRQILHSTKKTDMLKVDSAIEYLKSLNANINYINHPGRLTPMNAHEIVAPYDLVLDCTDHPTSRYLISDICVLLYKPLVSASALRTDGQLTVLNYPPRTPGDSTGGPCYRCVFPKPPPAESVVSCGDGGIIGPVVGVMGVLQALEAIKVIVSGLGKPGVDGKPLQPPSLLLFSTNGPTSFRSVKLRPRRGKCFACSEDAALSLESLTSGSLDYIMFCGVTSPVNLLGPEERIEAALFDQTRRAGKRHLLVDVREKVQFDICSLEGSVNVPFSSLSSALADTESTKLAWIPEDLEDDAPIYVICRLGNDSQVATKKFKEAGLNGSGRYIGDIRGGLKAWKAKVDPSWPDY